MAKTRIVAPASEQAEHEPARGEVELEECWEIIHGIDDLIEVLLRERCFVMAAFIRVARITSPQRGPAGGYLPPCTSDLADVVPGLTRFVLKTRERRRRSYARQLNKLFAEGQLAFRLGDPAEAPREEGSWRGDWLLGRSGRTQRTAA
jgi:hypothetical protein